MRRYAMNVRLNVNTTTELNDRLDVLAEKSGTTKSELLRKAITLMDLAVTERGRGKHRIAACGLRIADCGLRIADCGFR